MKHSGGKKRKGCIKWNGRARTATAFSGTRLSASAAVQPQ